jgi:putative flippase GtrA
MQQVHLWISRSILQIIDWFYPIFKKILPLQTYRYAACGGFNTFLDIGLFFLSYQFIFKKEPFVFGGLTIGPHIAAFLLAFVITFPIGFYLSRYVVWQETDARKRDQLGKYFIVVIGCIFLNYAFLKIFVDGWGWYATPSKMLTTVFVVAFSYFSQKYYTFKPKQ